MKPFPSVVSFKQKGNTIHYSPHATSKHWLHAWLIHVGRSCTYRVLLVSLHYRRHTLSHEYRAFSMWNTLGLCISAMGKGTKLKVIVLSAVHRSGRKQHHASGLKTTQEVGGPSKTHVCTCTACERTVPKPQAGSVTRLLLSV